MFEYGYRSDHYKERPVLESVFRSHLTNNISINAFDLVHFFKGGRDSVAKMAVALHHIKNLLVQLI